MTAPPPPEEPLIEAAKHFLSKRHFGSCRSYALRAQHSAPKHPDAAQILAVATTLSASQTLISENQPDWYAILRIHRYSQDTQLIKQQFKKLTLISLAAERSRLPFAEEAVKFVYDAYKMLSDPLKKAQFDSELQVFEKKKANDETFWTMCPYCYYLYEYARVYEDCCLRCQSEKCGRGFHAVAVKSPPVEVVEKGNYMCSGFAPLGKDQGVSLWSPFSPLVKGDENVERKNVVAGVGDECKNEIFVEISDESDDSNHGVEGENEGSCVNKDGKVGGTGEVEQNDDFVRKPVMKRRKKSVPKNAKKLMGKGTRIGKMWTDAQNAEGLDLNAEAGEVDGDDGNGYGNGSGNGNHNEFGGVEMGGEADFDLNGVDILTGDDDIFVGFPDLF